MEQVVGEGTRPTRDSVRESIFNIIGLRVRGANVLDPFAGTGAYGAECLSRGARAVVLNDIDISAVSTIEKNLNFAGEGFEIFNLDWKELLKKLSTEIADGVREPFDLVLLDPPYDTDFGVRAIEYLVNNKMLNPNAQIIFESDREVDLSKYDVRTKKYGRAFVYIIIM